MHFANALVWEIIGPAMAGPTGPCATPMRQEPPLSSYYFKTITDRQTDRQVQ